MDAAAQGLEIMGDVSPLRRGVRCMALGYLVGIGCALHGLPPLLRAFLVVWPLAVFGIEHVLERQDSAKAEPFRQREQKKPAAGGASGEVKNEIHRAVGPAIALAPGGDVEDELFDRRERGSADERPERALSS
ncbi:MAG TPA: hypothetical protein VK989_19775, partial [Polyangia bacterium]|nr:hypothetical protein [Polyangia bacterium]